MNNNVSIRATVREITPKGVIVDCKRKSGTVDQLFIRCYTSVLTDIDIGQKIEVNGSIKTMNKNDKYHKRTYIDAKSLLCGGMLNSLPDEQNVEIEGVICKQCVQSVTKSGLAIAGFVLAFNETEQKSYYPQCICWGVDALMVSQLSIGTPVKISGRLQSRDYSKNGENNRTYEISCSSVEVLS